MSGTHNEIRCPKCDSSIFVSADQAGDRIKCPRCQNPILVPGKKPKSDRDISVDDLIDIDDDILHPNPDGAEIVARSVDEAVQVEAKPVDLPSELQLAPESVEPPEDPPAMSSEPEPVTQKTEDDDDLGDLIDIPVTEPIKEDADPFEVDENADLKVEGVTPHDGQFGVDCHLCGSLLYARLSQVGTQIKCHDCHSMVDVPEPRREVEPVTEEPPVTDESSGGYKLSDPVDLEPMDTTFDISLGEIDYDDDEFFEKKRELEAGIEFKDEDESVLIQDAMEQPQESAQPAAPVDAPVAKAVPPESESEDDEYNLLPVPDDVPEVKSDLGRFRQSTNISTRVSDEPEPSRPAPEPPAKSTGSDRDVPMKVDAEPPEEKDKEKFVIEDGLDYAGSFSNMGRWFSDALQPLKNMNGLMRLALATVAIGGCYLVMSWGTGYFGDEYNQAQKFGGFALVLLGGLPLAAILFFLGVIGNSVVRIAIERRGSLSEWPDFSFADWASQFLYLGTSFWLAAFPGVILGSLMMFATRDMNWLFIFIIMSSLMFAPLILSSVVFNESPWAFVTSDVYKSIKPMKNRWVRFLTVSCFMGLIIGAGIYLIPFGPLCFLVAGIQVALLFVYWWILGDLVGNVVRWMTDKE